MDEIITRDEAIERGLKHYRTGQPCIHGHMAERWVSDQHCVVCKLNRGRRIYATPEGRLRQIEWSRQWQRNNREHWNEYQNRRNRAKAQANRQTIDNEKLPEDT